MFFNDVHLKGNDSDSAPVTVIAQADLAITKTATPSPVLAGGILTYTVTSNNTGPSSAKDVSIADALPGVVLFKTATPSAGGQCTTPPVDGSGTVTCTWSGATAAGTSRSVVIDVEVPGPQTIVNTASTTSATEDPNTTNNQTSVATDITCTINGTDGNDSLTGTDGFDVICGYGGNDTIRALAGDDRVFAGAGNDNTDSARLLVSAQGPPAIGRGRADHYRIPRGGEVAWFSVEILGTLVRGLSSGSCALMSSVSMTSVCCPVPTETAGAFYRVVDAAYEDTPSRSRRSCTRRWVRRVRAQDHRQTPPSTAAPSPGCVDLLRLHAARACHRRQGGDALTN